MKKTNNNRQNNANAIFATGKEATTYHKPTGAKVEQAQPKYSDIKRGVMVLADEELRSFGQCLKALKSVQNVPAFADMLNADALTLDMFNIDYLRVWLPFRFNANDDLCKLVILTEGNRDKYAGFEAYTTNGKEVVKVPCKTWSISAFYNLFKSARRAELKKGKEAEKARKEAKKAEQLRQRLALQRSRLEARGAKLAQMNAGKSE